MIKYGLSAFAAGYKRELEAHPLRTKMATSALLFSFGDYFCQKSEAAYKSRCQPKDSIKSEELNRTSLFNMLTQDWDMKRTIR